MRLATEFTILLVRDTKAESLAELNNLMPRRGRFQNDVQKS